MLKQRAFAATAWSSADIVVRQGLQFLVILILARLISPEDFGVVAVLALFMGIAGVMVDGGLSTALIQRQDINHTDESTVFWFNAGVGLLLAGLLALLAAPIAAYFDRPVLRVLTLVAAITVFFSALGAVHTALLVKRLDFRTQLKAGVAATVCTGVVSIAMAMNGFGVWALAAQMLGMAAMSTLFLWLLHRWRPMFLFSTKSARKLFGFGGYVLAANLLDTLYTRAYSLLIGRYIGIRELGFYARADHTKQLPVSLLTGILGRVALPLFSEAAYDPAKLTRGMQVSIRGLMLVNLPLMLGLAAVAEPLILMLFGEVWRDAIAPFRILCLAALLWPLHVININSLMAQGQARLVLRLEVPKKLLGLALLVAGMFFGIEGIAWSQVLFSSLAFIINGYYSGKLLGYGVSSQFRDVWPALVLAVAMTLLVASANAHLSFALPIQLIVLGALGSAFFLGAAFLVKLEALRDAIDLIRKSAPEQVAPVDSR
jgi:teichuronic acid exporter